MQRSYGLAPTKQQQHSWNTTSSDYHSHTSKLERTPGVLNEVSRYPNVYKAFNKISTYGDQEQESTQHEVVQHGQRKSSPNAKAQKKFQVSDQRVEIVESAKDNDDKNCEVREDSIDNQADNFIQRKHKGFDLSKWKTFKLS